MLQRSKVVASLFHECLKSINYVRYLIELAINQVKVNFIEGDIFESCEMTKNGEDQVHFLGVRSKV